MPYSLSITRYGALAAPVNPADAFITDQWYHYDNVGNVRFIVESTDAATSAATVEWTAAYTAWGTDPEEHGTNPDPHRANTKEGDATGILNEGHRYRCLEKGMFITMDPTPGVMKNNGAIMLPPSVPIPAAAKQDLKTIHNANISRGIKEE